MLIVALLPVGNQHESGIGQPVEDCLVLLEGAIDGVLCVSLQDSLSKRLGPSLRRIPLAQIGGDRNVLLAIWTNFLCGLLAVSA